MKKTILFLAAVALLGVVCGCKPSTRVTFKPALISIDVGPGWQVMNIPQEPPACTPTLLGKAGMINGLLLDDNLTDIPAAAVWVQRSLATVKGAVPESFKQENFSTDSGLGGIHISYDARSTPNGAVDRRSHQFITPGRSRRCVSISYITSPDAESKDVIAAIQKTIQVE